MTSNKKMIDIEREINDFLHRKNLRSWHYLMVLVMILAIVVNFLYITVCKWILS